jgi:hypothetical protein
MCLFGHVTGVRAWLLASPIIKEELLETIFVCSAAAWQLSSREPEPARFQVIQGRDNSTGLRQQICRRIHIDET